MQTMRSSVVPTIALVLMAQTLPAVEPVVIKTDWPGLQQYLPLRTLDRRPAMVSLITGDVVKVRFLRAEEDGLVVVQTRETKQWATKNREARIPRGLVSGVRFSGKVGRKGLILGLAGMAAGSIPISDGNCEECVGILALPLIPALGILGYLVGHSFDKPAPAFVIER